MFNKYTIMNSHDHRNALRDVARSNEKIADSIRDASAAEIKAKDRVDITLEEYERMKSRIDELEAYKLHSENIFKRIDYISESLEIPLLELFEHADTSSFYSNYIENPNDFKRKFMLTFNVDKYDWFDRRNKL